MGFIPPRTPHFDGLWEAAVRSAIFHFYRVVGASILDLDELRTLAHKISSILNSRPLCPISETAENLEVPEPEARLSRWQRVTKMQQHFFLASRKEKVALRHT